jgi:hypothetical protein
MCDRKAARSQASRIRPHWGALYVALAGVGTASLVAELAVPAGFWRATARAVFAAFAFATMAVWIRHEAVALEQAEWCDCASSMVTMRVIPSRPWAQVTPADGVPVPVVAVTTAEAGRDTTAEASSPGLEPVGVQ